MTSSAGSAQAVASSGRIPWKLKLWRGGWMVTAFGGIGALLFFLLGSEHQPIMARMTRRPATQGPAQAVNVHEDGEIVVAATSPLSRRLEHVVTCNRRVNDPLLTVSGIVVARILPGEEDLQSRWHFHTPELGAAHSNWLKVNSEKTFARSQLDKTRELVKAETDYLDGIVKRLEPLLGSGGVPERNVLSARADLLKAQLQGQKDIFAAESALRVAENERVALERELSQDGIEPVVFSRAVDNMVLVSANVPEARVSLVHEGEGCRVRFYAYPDKSFDAHVETLSTTVTHELRTMRVLFELSDLEGILRPGMFAEVGLGTDDRESLSIPAPALIHIGNDDYLIEQSDAGVFRPLKIAVGGFRDNSYEVLGGLRPGQTIVTEGAILLKPAVIESLQRHEGTPH